MGLCILAENHGQRVGLLARGATGAPHQQRAAPSFCSAVPAKPFCDQEIEVSWLAKKIGLVGSDYIDEGNDLLIQSLATEKIIAILGVRG